MAKEESIQTTGVIIEALPAGKFRVQLDTGHVILAYVGGKMRKFSINIAVGDKVKLEMSPYDIRNGRITYRL